MPVPETLGMLINSPQGHQQKTDGQRSVFASFVLDSCTMVLVLHQGVYYTIGRNKI